MKQRKVLNYDEVNHIVRRYRIRIGKFKILQNGLLEIDGGFKMCDTTLTKLPLSFASVTGDFIVRSNRLTTLKGCPAVVGGDFDCKQNELTSLKFSPSSVGRHYHCQENNLGSLVGAPAEVAGSFSCFLNKLPSLLHSPKIVGQNYYASHNLLTILEGPVHVGWNFNVAGNPLANIFGCPDHVGNVFSIDNMVPSLYMGDKNCIVKVVKIEKLGKITHHHLNLPQIILKNKKHLPILFKYNRLSEVWNPNNSINYENLDDMLFEINDGML